MRSIAVCPTAGRPPVSISGPPGREAGLSLWEDHTWSVSRPARTVDGRLRAIHVPLERGVAILDRRRRGSDAHRRCFSSRAISLANVTK